MATLADILEQKRQEHYQSTAQMFQGIGAGAAQQGQQLTAAVAQGEANRPNPINSIVKGGAAGLSALALGANPITGIALGAAGALTAPKGETDIGGSAVQGAATGVTGSKLDLASLGTPQGMQTAASTLKAATSDTAGATTELGTYAAGQIAQQNAKAQSTFASKVSDAYSAGDPKKVMALRDTEEYKSATPEVKKQLETEYIAPTIKQINADKNQARLTDQFKSNLDEKKNEFAQKEADKAARYTAIGGKGAATKLSPKAKALLDDASTSGVKLNIPALGLGGSNRIDFLNSLADEMKSKGYSASDLGIIQSGMDSDILELKKVKSQAGGILPFEKTAEANISVLEKAAERIPNATQPIANKLLMSIGLQATGSTDITKYETAERTAINEVSRVLSSANGAGVVSDSARKEAGDILQKNPTKKGIAAALEILKQDLANRKKGILDTEKEIMQRMHNPVSYLDQLKDGGSSDLVGPVVNGYQKNTAGNWVHVGTSQ